MYNKIKKAKKPRSGTKYDLPRDIINEFGPEIATPLTQIINTIFSSGEWPMHWKLEHVVPIPKIPVPESEEDLRPISLTPFFSKVGGLRGNSINHYIIEFINFVLSSQDTNDKTAVLACFIDFQKAFMRMNHNIIIEKLSDMGVEGWLLRIIISFLKDRTMFVNHRGGQSSVKPLPGGGLQGTILALLGFHEQSNNAGEQEQGQNC